MQAGIIASALLNVNPNSRKHDHRATDFVLEFEAIETAPRKKSTKDLWMQLTSFAINHNARLENREQHKRAES